MYGLGTVVLVQACSVHAPLPEHLHLVLDDLAGCMQGNEVAFSGFGHYALLGM